MKDRLDHTDRAIAAFMARVADAHGRSDPAPDPDAIWLRAQLEQRPAISLAAILPLIWFLAWRPMRNAR